jgi:pimeloyl-ACP methyl ester carboxylesterase
MTQARAARDLGDGSAHATMDGAKVEAGELVIGYDVQGAGPPLLMLHAATSSGSTDFGSQVPHLSQAFRCFLPDARGHGRTRWDPDRGFRAAMLVDDAIAFADALGLRTFHLLAFSMGAMTALQVAARYPDRIRTLVVAGISPRREPRASVARRLMDPVRLDARDPAWAARLSALHDPVQGPGTWRRLLPAIAADVAAQPLLSPADQHRIDPPTLVVVGDRDPFVPVDHAWGLARQVRHGRLLVVPDCGHEVMRLQPDLVNDALTSFYRSTEATARERAGLDETEDQP